MRILHFGNIANNGYNNAKLLRRAGVEADAACDETHPVGTPEWEDAPRWRPAPSGGLPEPEPWARPPWVLPTRAPPRRPRGWYLAAYTRSLAAALPSLRRLYRELQPEARELAEVHERPLSFADVVAGYRAVWIQSLIVGPLGPLIRAYDTVQAYATHPVLALVAAPERPFVAYEHGTMREIPFEDSWRGRLLSIAYRRAHRVIITNPDVIGAAHRLGLRNHTFVPHPLDEEKYTPGASHWREKARLGDGPLLLAPARHDWQLKGNDRLLDAFAALLRGGIAPRATLVLNAWGDDLERSRELVRQLGIHERVRWFAPFPKVELIEAYRSADVVLDQFELGTFGGIPPEAMACARPVVCAYDPELHRWCFPEDPPVFAAATAEEICARLRELLNDPDAAEDAGRAGRNWIERHHGWRLVVERQRAIYAELPGAPEPGASRRRTARGARAARPKT